MFEKASREKFRFNSPQGMLTVEDLWDLPLISKISNLANLDDIAKSLNRAMKEQGAEESFVIKERAENNSLRVKFELVKHVIAVKLDELEAQKKARESRAKKQQILAIIAKKEDAQLEGSSIEDLRKMVEEL